MAGLGVPAGVAGKILGRLGKCDCHEPSIVIPRYACWAAKTRGFGRDMAIMAPN